MGLREDVKYRLVVYYEPKVPYGKTILKQAQEQIIRGKSTGRMSLDIQAIKTLAEEEER